MMLMHIIMWKLQFFLHGPCSCADQEGVGGGGPDPPPLINLNFLNLHIKSIYCKYASDPSPFLANLISDPPYPRRKCFLDPRMLEIAKVHGCIHVCAILISTCTVITSISCKVFYYNIFFSIHAPYEQHTIQYAFVL